MIRMPGRDAPAIPKPCGTISKMSGGSKGARTVRLTQNQVEPGVGRHGHNDVLLVRQARHLLLARQRYVGGNPLAEDVDLGVVAKLTPGFPGADIENLVNEAAILAARAWAPRSELLLDPPTLM